jgi:hypothetical protein
MGFPSFRLPPESISTSAVDAGFGRRDVVSGIAGIGGIASLD